MTPPSAPRFGQFGGKAGLGLAFVGLRRHRLRLERRRRPDLGLAQFPYLISGGLVGPGAGGPGRGDARRAGRPRGPRAARGQARPARRGRARGRRPRRTEAGTPRDLSGLVVAGTASYHVPGCRLVDGREETGYLTPAEARERELKACRVCQPDAATEVTVR